MNPMSYVTFKWLLANLLHPFFFYAGMHFYEGGNQSLFSHFNLEMLMLIGAGGFVCSLPPLIFSYLAIDPVTRIKVPVPKLFMIWFGVSTFILALEHIILSYFFLEIGFRLLQEHLLFMLPAMLSVLVANLIMVQQFKKIVEYQQQEVSEPHPSQ